MKIFLQHNQTKAFFTPQNDWATEIDAARLFATSHDVLRFCAERCLNDVQMIINFDDSRFDMTIPVIIPAPVLNLNRTILLVEDNPDDVLLIHRAFKKTGINDAVHVVVDGEQAVAYLSGEEEFADRARFPLPRLIVMDVKMPRMSGLEVLQWMNSRADLRAIPKIILSSSQLDADIATAYDLGANTYFSKPNAFEDLLLLVKSIHDYWLMNEAPAEPFEERRPETRVDSKPH